MPSTETFQAVTRFGLGPTGDDLTSITDARAWLLAQLHNPSIPTEVTAQPGDRLDVSQLADDKKQKMLTDAQGNGVPIRQAYLQTTYARFQAQLTTRQPFIERLTMFWSNHFTVSIQKPIIAGIVNRFEVEAIRPYVTGTFRDMLLATARHPAMLLYLDNAQSIGPNSIAGQRRGKGLNENYAREVMELHTLGVDGGYTQADVTALAHVLTGWSLAQGSPGERILEYQFQPRFHEPGDKAWLGYRIKESGEQEGVDALSYLAGQPATAKHIATQFARYFIADDPPASAVAALTKTFTETHGHLGKLAETLVNLPEAWAQPLAKFKDPYDYTLSLWRMIGTAPEQKQLFGMLEALDYRVFNALSPAGYPDTVESWASPDAVNKRIEMAYRFAQKLPDTIDPAQWAARAIGPVMSDMTLQTIHRAATGRDGIALLLSSPEFLRR